MSALSKRMEALGKRCRHYDARSGLIGGNCCKIGHPIDKIVKAANGGNDLGLAFLRPCHPGPERKADCPSYDPKTDNEIAAEKKAMQVAMDRFVERLPKIAVMKRKMVKHKLSRAKSTCPWCNAKDSFRLTCALSVNNHVHGRCDECGEGFME